ncbi:MAG: hypothetical protein MSS82_03060 [Bacteroidales bacterium]|nr:hypothetical protein [Bacteroidales bacterium]
MAKKVLIALLAMFICLPGFAGSKRKADKDTNRFRYEIECAGNGVQGTYLLKVWSFSKKPHIAIEQCKKNAVHGVIFKGTTGTNGCIPQRALAATPGIEMEYKEYFDYFFNDNGEYLKYVSLTEGTQEILKVGKEYKVGVIVSVQKDALRKALEQAGVIKALGAGF